MTGTQKFSENLYLRIGFIRYDNDDNECKQLTSINIFQITRAST